jgi:hypothetical protein
MFGVGGDAGVGGGAGNGEVLDQCIFKYWRVGNFASLRNWIMLAKTQGGLLYSFEFMPHVSRLSYVQSDRANSNAISRVVTGTSSSGFDSRGEIMQKWHFGFIIYVSFHFVS